MMIFIKAHFSEGANSSQAFRIQSPQAQKGIVI